MEKLPISNTRSASLFAMDGIPHFFEALPLALQHVVAMIVGCVTPAIIVAGAAGLSQPDRIILIQASLIAAAIGTILQLYPLGKAHGHSLRSRPSGHLRRQFRLRADHAVPRWRLRHRRHLRR